ncbi:ATPase [Candidatus Gottesmanbacteria bacterium RIFCSPLOWO2_02_FULL_42_29]|nr:MAG: ATPase [Candidatus Gottesmanbacteria bacterium RIFCSPLOWO2_12_FULL_42_10]OGG39110.1 MAG: ATPase [Candidatus Gottesmanbacteria bacterium RIFCSPLOWO2_02_FULL_42_29]
MKFINRDKELTTLNKSWKSKTPQLFILYGKRRVGKTELIKQFIKDKQAVYYLADKRTTKEQLSELSRLVGEAFNDQFLIQRGFGNWLEVFQYLGQKKNEKFVFAVDEYPYLTEVDKSISSVFQKGWDEYLKKTKATIILSGSSVSMMESEALSYKSPLYGRRTGQFLLKPLAFYESWKFFPDKSFEEFLKLFSITGGLPGYLLQLNSELSLPENIKSKIFDKTSFLFNEIEFILKEELREPKNYLAILKAISWGKTKFGEIVNETGMEKNVLNKYLQTLDHLQLIEKEAPVTEKQLLKSRRGLYKIADNFTRFWFQYIYPYTSDLEIERFEQVNKKLKDSFQILEAAVYEKLCQEILWKLENKIFSFGRVGRWWEGSEEIDVVGLNEQTKEIIFGEAKWSENPVSETVLNKLMKKALSMSWNKENRKEYYILFSKSGFSEGVKEKAGREKNIFLVHKDKLL